ncbi:hypothetical protein THOG11_20153 [Vibrio harveyi]|nr:hypothetical protein TH15OA1_530244 [Vibrio harveyi]CAH1555404.1 hypothetical protein THOD03_20150 [Vibrio harveyi]CAH1562202.1 hypothetical protein THOG11_20153 [Vibrio harveyi]
MSSIAYFAQFIVILLFSKSVDLSVASNLTCKTCNVIGC